jgi:3-phosphoshikimate 1-carboxyvinyltransferase
MITLHPGRLKGTLAAPPSKSMAHRALICAALAQGESIVSPVDDSEDMRATIGCMQALGADIFREGKTLRLKGRAHAPEALPRMDCLESGSTLRFLIPLSLVLAHGGTFFTKGRLGERPLGPYEAAFAKQGITFERAPGSIRVRGKLAPGLFELPGDVSSQFVTGLLLSLPMLDGDSEIVLTTPPESEGYIDLTIQAMADFGVKVKRSSSQLFEIPGGQGYQARTYQVEGDYSQAAVLLCADALGSGAALRGLREDSLQGDRAAIDLLAGMGAKITREGDSFSLTGGALMGIVIDGGAFPDILPMMALVCCLAKGESRIENAGRLRLKECDRLAATAQELSKLGADIRAEGDTMVIRGREGLQGGVTVDSHNDHRMAMMLSIAALACREPIQLTDPGCVAKSWPGYWEDYISLGGRVK